MSQDLDLLDVVVLTEDLPNHGLQRGHVGTIVEVLAPDTYEAEFDDDSGTCTSYALVPLEDTQLLKLRTAPRTAS